MLLKPNPMKFENIKYFSGNIWGFMQYRKTPKPVLGKESKYSPFMLWFFLLTGIVIKYYTKGISELC